MCARLRLGCTTSVVIALIWAQVEKGSTVTALLEPMIRCVLAAVFDARGNGLVYLPSHARFTNIGEASTQYKGITALEFVLDPTVLLNATYYAPNNGYYAYGPNGLMNLTSVQHMVKVR